MADYAIHDTTLIGTSNIIRKKEGSSALIDPADYPKRINLMGMLEEKTISGAVASCSDGADDVPISSWLIDVNPTLSGKSQIIATQTGKNLFDKNATPYQTGKYIISTSVIGSSDFTYTNNANYNVYRIKIEKNTSYVISSIKANAPCWGLMSTSGLVTYVYPNNGASEGVNITLTTGATDAYLFVSVAVTGTYKCDDVVQVEVGSTATAYEQYNAETNTVNLGQTIYGGQADVVNGTGVETHGAQSFSGSETWMLSGTSFWYTTKSNPNVKASQTITASNGVVIRYSTNGQIRCYLSDNVGVVDTSTDMNALFNSNEWFGYELATPEDFTFTPISPTPETYLNSNCFWGDTGDSEVVYRSSGTITPIVPTLISKTITENDTYNASDDNADGYSSVTVNVPTGDDNSPVTLIYTEIATDANLTGTLTFTGDYHDYAMLKVVMYNPSTQGTEEVICTPRFIDDAFQYSSNKANFNMLGTNLYAYYGLNQDDNWVRGGSRTIYVSSVYGVDSSTHDITVTNLYRYQSINSGNRDVSFSGSIFDNQYLAISVCDGDNTETQPSFQLIPTGNSGINAFSNMVAGSAYESVRYFIIGEHSVRDRVNNNRYGFFTIDGIKFTKKTGGNT